MYIYTDIEKFNLPNFLTITKNGKELAKIDIGELDLKEAEKFWTDMQAVWIAHVKKRQEVLKNANAVTT